MALALLTLASLAGWGDAADEWRETLRLQVALDRLGFSPGLIDGKAGRKTAIALEALRKARGGAQALSPSDVVPADLQATCTYVIAQGDVAIIGPVPQDWTARAELDAMTYDSMLELLAERGHCTRATVTSLNKDLGIDALGPGDKVVLPNVIAAEQAQAPPAAEIVVDLSQKTVTAEDGVGKTLALLHCSIAAFAEKRPQGRTSVKVIAMNPDYTFDPEKWPEVKSVDRKLRIPPGPRNPVGLAWIGLELPGYGIHGTAWPELIGKTGSHGCIRLANWDAVRLARMVHVGTPVRFTSNKADAADAPARR